MIILIDCNFKNGRLNLLINLNTRAFWFLEIFSIYGSSYSSIFKQIFLVNKILYPTSVLIILITTVGNFQTVGVSISECGILILCEITQSWKNSLILKLYCCLQPKDENTL